MAKILTSDKIFQAALMVSILFHCSVLVRYPNLLWRKHITKSNKKEIKVAYIKELPQVKNLQRPLLQNDNVKVNLNDKNIQIPPPFLDNAKNNLLENSIANLSKPVISKPDVLALKKRITMPEIDIDKQMRNPSYMGYYQLIREKIRKSAYYNYSHSQTGEVYVTFLITKDGNLKEVKFIESKSTQSEYLKNISMNSVRQAAPFPAFPKELAFEQLSFNVVISFEVDS